MKLQKDFRDSEIEGRNKEQKWQDWNKGVRVTNTEFKLFIFIRGFINDGEVVILRMSKIFKIIKFTGDIRRIKVNVHCTKNVSIESSHFLLRMMIRKSMRKKRDYERFFEDSHWDSVCLENNASRKESCHFKLFFSLLVL